MSRPNYDENFELLGHNTPIFMLEILTALEVRRFMVHYTGYSYTTRTKALYCQCMYKHWNIPLLVII